MGGQEIGVVKKHIYLGFVVDEHGHCRRMVDERVKAGARAVSDWLRKRRTLMGEIRGVPFKRLVEVLDSVLYIVRSRDVGMYEAA